MSSNKIKIETLKDHPGLLEDIVEDITVGLGITSDKPSNFEDVLKEEKLKESISSILGGYITKVDID